MGAALATTLFLDHRDTMIFAAGALLLAFGVAELAGRSLSFIRLGGEVTEAQTLLGTYSLGLVYGFGGFCSGPILGSVLTVAAAGASPIRGGALLAVYALGTTVPLFLLAALWDRAEIGRRRWVRGWGFRVGAFSIHSTNLVAGAVFVLLGLSFIVLEGTTSLSGLYERWGFTDVSFEADSWIQSTLSPVPDVFILAIVGGLVGIAAWTLWRRSRRAATASRYGPSPPGERISEHESA